MKTLLLFRVVTVLCYSSKEQIEDYSSKDVITSSKDVIVLEDNFNPLDIQLRMPICNPLPPIISPKPITEVNP